MTKITQPNAISLVTLEDGVPTDEIFVYMHDGAIHFSTYRNGRYDSFVLDQETSDAFVHSLNELHRRSLKRRAANAK